MRPALLIAASLAPTEEFGHVTIEDRKSTRLNSSHSQISYAVFCLKKKKLHGRLGSDVTKCLARTPANPYITYATIRASLGPIRSTSSTRAVPGRAFRPVALDSYVP